MIRGQRSVKNDEGRNPNDQNSARFTSSPRHRRHILRELVIPHRGIMLRGVKGKLFLPLALVVVFALSRIPGMMPQNFSAAYALVFCCGVYFSGKMAWWLPLGTLVATDLCLNLYYQLYLGVNVWEFSVLKYQLINYVAYVVLIWLGRRFKPQFSFISLLGGGILGALIFYFLTNTASWFFNPFQNLEYTKNLSGWLTALTKGTSGWPTTLEFFRNTLLSGGLFTGLFVGAMKLSEAAEKEEAEPASGEVESEPEEADAPAANHAKLR
jgi:hypothetical protein